MHTSITTGVTHIINSVLIIRTLIIVTQRYKKISSASSL